MGVWIFDRYRRFNTVPSVTGIGVDLHRDEATCGCCQRLHQRRAGVGQIVGVLRAGLQQNGSAGEILELITGRAVVNPAHRIIRRMCGELDVLAQVLLAIWPGGRQHGNHASPTESHDADALRIDCGIRGKQLEGTVSVRQRQRYAFRSVSGAADTTRGPHIDLERCDAGVIEFHRIGVSATVNTGRAMYDDHGRHRTRRIDGYAKHCGLSERLGAIEGLKRNVRNRYRYGTRFRLRRG